MFLTPEKQASKSVNCPLRPSSPLSGSSKGLHTIFGGVNACRGVDANPHQKGVWMPIHTKKGCGRQSTPKRDASKEASTFHCHQQHTHQPFLLAIILQLILIWHQHHKKHWNLQSTHAASTPSFKALNTSGCTKTVLVCVNTVIIKLFLVHHFSFQILKHSSSHESGFIRWTHLLVIEVYCCLFTSHTFCVPNHLHPPAPPCPFSEDHQMWWDLGKRWAWGELGGVNLNTSHRCVWKYGLLIHSEWITTHSSIVLNEYNSLVHQEGINLKWTLLRKVLSSVVPQLHSIVLLARALPQASKFTSTYSWVLHDVKALEAPRFSSIYDKQRRAKELPSPPPRMGKQFLIRSCPTHRESRQAIKLSSFSDNPACHYGLLCPKMSYNRRNRGEIGKKFRKHRIKISMSATGQKAGYTIFCRHRSTNTYTDQIIDSIRGSNCEVLKCPRKCIFTWLVGKYQDIDALIYDRVELPPFHTSRPRTLIDVQFIYKIHRSPSSHGWSLTFPAILRHLVVVQGQALKRASHLEGFEEETLSGMADQLRYIAQSGGRSLLRKLSGDRPPDLQVQSFESANLPTNISSGASAWASLVLAESHVITLSQLGFLVPQVFHVHPDSPIIINRHPDHLSLSSRKHFTSWLVDSLTPVCINGSVFPYEICVEAHNGIELITERYCFTLWRSSTLTFDSGLLVGGHNTDFGLTHQCDTITARTHFSPLKKTTMLIVVSSDQFALAEEEIILNMNWSWRKRERRLKIPPHMPTHACMHGTPLHDNPPLQLTLLCGLSTSEREPIASSSLTYNMSIPHNTQKHLFVAPMALTKTLSVDFEHGSRVSTKAKQPNRLDSRQRIQRIARSRSECDKSEWELFTEDMSLIGLKERELQQARMCLPMKSGQLSTTVYPPSSKNKPLVRLDPSSQPAHLAACIHSQMASTVDELALTISDHCSVSFQVTPELPALPQRLPSQ
ncbi:hypothetical protein VP01_522g1 [Puccinia sorghi]|uniref:Uncharacterized protein n=1 Tax=Puccinia sorghi TaxID=27349 RepID=A0A0L6UKL1_9BASI|nr:hypothetical protein VP01_522g1 [Puccinia sorghi]